MQMLVGEENLGRIRRTVITIALTTLTLEAVGGFFLYEFSDSIVDSDDRIFFSIFHAVSGFCNAGFTLTTDNFALEGIRGNAGFLTTIMALIVLGGIGFPVLSNVWSVATSRANPRPRLSLHTKIVVFMTAILILAGTAAFLILDLGTGPDNSSFLDALFLSISARTAGFNTIDTAGIALPALFVLVLLMWIGASPGSTGGGVKTTTAALAFLNIRAVASGRNRIEMFGKQVPTTAVVKAFSTALLSFGFIALMLFALLLTEKRPFEDLLFEVVSAMSTVGLSTGVTSALSPTGKIVIILSMLFGRVGLLAVVIALTKKKEEGYYEYTNENVLVT